MNQYLKIALSVIIGAVLVAVLAPYLIMGFVALGWATVPIFVVGVITKILYEVVKHKLKKK